jgi:hypothetical protein
MDASSKRSCLICSPQCPLNPATLGGALLKKLFTISVLFDAARFALAQGPFMTDLIHAEIFGPFSARICRAANGSYDMESCEFATHLTGGPGAGDFIANDDDLAVYVNGVLVFADQNGLANSVAPIALTVKPGDQIRVVATNVSVGCIQLGPLYLRRDSDGAVQPLDPVGVPPTCSPPQPTGTFYDQVFTVAFP